MYRATLPFAKDSIIQYSYSFGALQQTIKYLTDQHLMQKNNHFKLN